jgi:hypothetical protein
MLLVSDFVEYSINFFVKLSGIYGEQPCYNAEHGA